MLQQISSTGYGYVAPTLDKARKNVPMLNSTVQRIEPHMQVLIQKGDGIIDSSCAIVERRTATVRGGVVSVQGKVSDLTTAASKRASRIINENPLILTVHKNSLALVDSTESLIDRLLPLPATENEDGKKVKKVERTALIPRAILLPFRIPARTIHIVAFKAGGATQAIVVDVKWAVQLTQDQKAKLSAWIAHNSREMMDKVSSSTAVVTLKKSKSDAARKLQVARQSLSDGQRAIEARVYLVCERLHIIELKDLTVEKLEALQKNAAAAVKSATQMAYTATGRVAGNERATIIFERIGQRVPTIKSALIPEEVPVKGSTGSLEAVAEQATTPLAPEGGTGALETEVQAMMRTVVAAKLPPPQARYLPKESQLPQMPQMKRTEAVDTGLSAAQAGLSTAEGQFRQLWAPRGGQLSQLDPAADQN